MPKLTIREWIYAVHMPPEVMADFEDLFGLPAKWRDERHPPQEDWEARGILAAELESLLEGKKP